MCSAPVLLGPGYAVGMAFAAALIRNLLGLGSLLAFPGSMIGALLCGVAYKLCPKLPAAYAGEFCGTGILGGLASYPIAAVLMATPRRRSSPSYRLSGFDRCRRSYLGCSCCPRSSARTFWVALREQTVEGTAQKSN